MLTQLNQTLSTVDRLSCLSSGMTYGLLHHDYDADKGKIHLTLMDTMTLSDVQIEVTDVQSFNQSFAIVR